MVVWDPKDYAGSSAAQQQWAREQFARLRLGGGEAVLDIGCGDGKVTAEIATVVPRGRVLGIDASPEMIAYARSAFPPARHDNLEFQCLDARQINFLQAFDLVFSNAALHWIDDQRTVVAAVARALRPGGRLIVSCGGRGNAADILDCAETLRRDAAWATFFTGMERPYYFLGPDDYGPWLREAGLRVTRLELTPKDMTHAGASGLAGWIRTTWLPYTQRVPEGRREAFINQMMELYLERYPLDAEGRAHVCMVRLEVEAARE